MSLPQDILDKIEDYLDGNLNDTDFKYFEKQLQNNDELQELVTVNKQMREHYNEDQLISLRDNRSKAVNDLTSYYKSEQGQKSKKMLEAVQIKYNKAEHTAVKPKNRYTFIGAAAVLLILIGYFFSDTLFSSDNYYESYSDWSELPSLTTKSDDNLVLAKGENAFSNKEYTIAKTSFERYLKETSSKNPTVLIYYGLSQLELNEFSNALETFDTLIASDVIDSSKGYWYKALVYLKMKETNKALEQLKIITNDTANYKYTEALELIKKIKH